MTIVLLAALRPAVFAVVLAPVVVLAVAVGVVQRRLKRCPSNRVLVVYDRKVKDPARAEHGVRFYHGGLVFVWPLIQRYAWIVLDTIRLEVPLFCEKHGNDDHTEGLCCTMSVAVGTSEPLLRAAAARFINRSMGQIKEQVEPIVRETVREFTAKMTPEQVDRNRTQCVDELQPVLAERLSQVGLSVLHVGIGGTPTSLSRT
ncbi:hypothetical protein JCM19992_30880 [Thermostilla marina]